MCRAEDTNSSYRYSFKVYGLSVSESFEYTQRFGIEDPYTRITEMSNWRIFHPTFALQWKTKADNYQEIEITFLEINSNELRQIDVLYLDNAYKKFFGGIKVTTTHLSLRYEYIYRFTKAVDRRFDFSLGAGINPYFFNISEDPVISNQFPTHERNMGAFFHVVPRIQFNLSNKLYMDLNVPFCLFYYNHRRMEREDPQLTEELKILTFTDNTLLPEVYSVRVGVGFRF
ncbi:MAG: hypothetical protein EA361_09045 [Bacteroidetes bacterium]|nr:MAG: hypothetical protein EA361_09045 [Bacteroidota bacterium]